MTLPRCEVCGEAIPKGKDKVVPPSMVGPSQVSMFVHANPKDYARERMPRTSMKACLRQSCASRRVRRVAPGGDAGFGNYPATNPVADIWECEDCQRAFLLTKG